jgi:hypothetical protein
VRNKSGTLGEAVATPDLLLICSCGLGRIPACVPHMVRHRLFELPLCVPRLRREIAAASAQPACGCQKLGRRC